MVANMTVHALEIDCWRGDLERARKRLDAATGGEPTDDPQSLAGLALHEAVVARAEGKPKVALEKLEPALDSRDHLGIRFLIVKLAIIEEAQVRLCARRHAADRARTRLDPTTCGRASVPRRSPRMHRGFGPG